MESYRGVTLASRNLNRAKFGTQISEEQRLNGTFESKAWPGSRKSRLQQSLKKDCDYLKQITTEFRTGEYRPSSGTSTNYTGSKTPNTASPYKIRKSSIIDLNIFIYIYVFLYMYFYIHIFIYLNI